MRILPTVIPLASLLATSPLQAQCFGRNLCDPSIIEIRSQMSVNVPVASQASTADTLKAIEDVRKQLYALAGRECATLHDIFGGDCSVAAFNMNSSVQERGMGNSIAFVSVSNTYEVRKAAK